MSFALGAAALGLVIAGDDVTAFLLSGHADAAMIATAGAVLSLIILHRRPRHPIGWGAERAVRDCSRDDRPTGCVWRGGDSARCGRRWFVAP